MNRGCGFKVTDSGVDMYRAKILKQGKAVECQDSDAVSSISFRQRKLWNIGYRSVSTHTVEAH